MSLVAFAVRIATVRVLRAALPACFAVLDSPVDPIDALALNPSAAVVAVYSGQNANKLDGTGFFAGAPMLNLNLQIFLPPQMTFSVGGQSVTLDTRAEGSETALDAIWYMIACALAERGAPWADLWGRFVQKVSDSVASSYLVETSKVKAVAREIRLLCDVIQEPTPGGAASDIWSRLLAAMTADAGSDNVSALAPWISALIASPGALAQNERDRIFLGISEYASWGINLTAAEVSPKKDPPLPLAEQADTISVVVDTVVTSP